MAVSALASPPRLSEEKAASSTCAGGQILVLDPVCQPPGMTPILLDRRRQFIGRDVECAIQLPDLGTPSRHAVILRGQRQVIIKAFDPQTWLNELPVTESSLCDGDLLKVGPFEFRVRGATAHELLQNLPLASRDLGFAELPEAACHLALRRARLATIRTRLKERREQLCRDFERLIPEQARLEQRGARLSTFRIRLKARGEQIRREQESLHAQRAMFEAERAPAITEHEAIASNAEEAPSAAPCVDIENVPAQSDAVLRSWTSDADRIKHLFHRPGPATAEAGSLDDATPFEPQPSKEEQTATEHTEIADSVAEYMKHLLLRTRSGRTSAAIAEHRDESTRHTSPLAAQVDLQEANPDTAAVEAVVIEPELPQEPSLSSSRRRHTIGEIRAGVGSLREVANFSARTAVANYTSRKLRRLAASILALTTISLVLVGGLFFLEKSESPYYSLAFGATMTGVIFLIELSYRFWKIRNLDSTRVQSVNGNREEIPQAAASTTASSVPNAIP